MDRPYIERARELWLRRGRGVRLQGLETHAPWQTHHAPEVLHLALCVTGSDPVTQTGGGEGRSFVISTGGAEGPGVEKSRPSQLPERKSEIPRLRSLRSLRSG